MATATESWLVFVIAIQAIVIAHLFFYWLERQSFIDKLVRKLQARKYRKKALAHRKMIRKAMDGM